MWERNNEKTDKGVGRREREGVRNSNMGWQSKHDLKLSKTNSLRHIPSNITSIGDLISCTDKSSQMTSYCLKEDKITRHIYSEQRESRSWNACAAGSNVNLLIVVALPRENSLLSSNHFFVTHSIHYRKSVRKSMLQHFRFCHFGSGNLTKLHVLVYKYGEESIRWFGADIRQPMTYKRAYGHPWNVFDYKLLVQDSSNSNNNNNTLGIG